MISNKPTLETIPAPIGSSINYRQFTRQEPNGNPLWHYHPEVELVFIQSSSGKRQIGHHISYYQNGDLILIGSNVPHYGFTDRFSRKNVEIVLQFLKSNLGLETRNIPEFLKINDLMNRADHGISFGSKTREKVGPIIQSMQLASSFDRLLILYRVLNILANTDDYELLNASEVTIDTSQQDKERVKVIYEYVREHFSNEITLEQMADLVHLTVPSFCRYFKKSTGRTFSRFVNEVRVIHACKLLSETGHAISDISYDCGYNNFSHFNKQFKEITGKSPSDYRINFRDLITKPDIIPTGWEIDL